MATQSYELTWASYKEYIEQQGTNMAAKNNFLQSAHWKQDQLFWQWVLHKCQGFHFSS